MHIGNLESLSSKLIGQQHALDAILPFVRRFKANLHPGGRPAGRFLLLGPTGTGKTYTVELLAEALHNDPARVLTIDCGEYQLDHEIARLVGSPPGYIGHHETEALLSSRRLCAMQSEACPLALILFDEVEKASPRLFNLLLGLLDKGRLTLGDNRTISFANTMIFMTSNLGAQKMIRNAGPGFVSPLPPDREGVERIGIAEARRKFSPEFLNRLDAIIVYHPLTREYLREILRKEVQKLAAFLIARGRPAIIEIPPEAEEKILDRAESERYGAREIGRIVERCILDPLIDVPLAKFPSTLALDASLELSFRPVK